jgi:adenine-specific DNA methylase
MVALVLKNPNERGKIYKLPSKKDFEIFQEAKNQLGKKIEEFTSKWGFNPIPDEPTPESHGRGAERAFPLRSYGLNKWGDVFNARQKLALITFLDHIKE